MPLRCLAARFDEFTFHLHEPIVIAVRTFRVGLGQNGHRVAIAGAVQIRVLLPRCFSPQPNSARVKFGRRLHRSNVAACSRTCKHASNQRRAETRSNYLFAAGLLLHYRRKRRRIRISTQLVFLFLDQIHDLPSLRLIGNDLEQLAIASDVLLIEVAFQIHGRLPSTGARCSKSPRLATGNTAYVLAGPCGLGCRHISACRTLVNEFYMLATAKEILRRNARQPCTSALHAAGSRGRRREGANGLRST